MAGHEPPTLPPLALTMGEPSGVGPDITLAAWTKRRTSALPPFYCLASPTHLAGRARLLGLDCPIEIVAPDEARSCFDRALPVVPLLAKVRGQVGQPDPGDAEAIVEAITRAVADVHAGAAMAVVTNPIHKQTLYASGFAFPGHTEFLATMSSTGGRAVMMLVAPDLRTVPVTVHVPIHDVPALLSEDVIVETARIVATDLRQRFGIDRPRLAVAGLNPHAGEGGTLGEEDGRIVRPAVAALVAEGIDTVGPLSADTLFHAAARAKYDAALCMYHDQALIPVKTIAFAETVNVTLGLDFIRTSPDHGTALDIAGNGTADPTSLMCALRLAAQMRQSELAA